MTQRGNTFEKSGVPGQGETYLGVKHGSPWDPEILADDPRTGFQRDIDALMAEALKNGQQVESYTAEFADGDWGVTVTEAAPVQVNAEDVAVSDVQEAVVTEASPFGVFEVKYEVQKNVISATGTIFDKAAQPQKVNQAETGAQDLREQKG